jgi:hypothetical protein
MAWSTACKSREKEAFCAYFVRLFTPFGLFFGKTWTLFAPDNIIKKSASYHSGR